MSNNVGWQFSYYFLTFDLFFIYFGTKRLLHYLWQTRTSKTWEVYCANRHKKANTKNHLRTGTRHSWIGILINVLKSLAVTDCDLVHPSLRLLCCYSKKYTQLESPDLISKSEKYSLVIHIKITGVQATQMHWLPSMNTQACYISSYKKKNSIIEPWKNHKGKTV